MAKYIDKYGEIKNRKVKTPKSFKGFCSTHRRHYMKFVKDMYDQNNIPHPVHANGTNNKVKVSIWKDMYMEHTGYNLERVFTRTIRRALTAYNERMDSLKRPRIVSYKEFLNKY